MQNTTHYNLKKPDYTDFADIQDINDNMDTIDEELAAPTGDARDQVVSFTDADLDTGITSFPTFLSKIVSGMKLAKFLREFKAGMAYVLHVGSLVNNATCTESGKALDARMGKTLQDQITSLNDSLEITSGTCKENSNEYVKYFKFRKIVVVLFQVVENFNANRWQTIALSTPLPNFDTSFGTSTVGICKGENVNVVCNVGLDAGTTIRINSPVSGVQTIRGQLLYLAE